MNVNFHGQEIEHLLHEEFPFLAMDKDGAVYGYKEAPVPADGFPGWVYSFAPPDNFIFGEYVWVCELDELAVDWKDSLIEVKK